MIDELQVANDEFVAEWQKLVVLVSELPANQSLHIAEQLQKTALATLKQQTILISSIQADATDALLCVKLMAFDLDMTKKEKKELEGHLADGQ